MTEETLSLLSVRGLSVGIQTARNVLPVVECLDFDLHEGKTLALVGESGCGKSLTALALMGLLPTGTKHLSGEIRFRGTRIDTGNQAQMNTLRGYRMAMVFQEPMNALNPVFPVGRQIGESLRIHRQAPRSQRRGRVHELLRAVGMPDPEGCATSYPHQLSGGMRQRVLIAMAIACNPDILIADEPSTALDVTVQAQVIDLLLDLQQRLGMAMLFISHDFAVVSHVADRIAVMYAGRLVESGLSGDVLNQPRHPYTRALIDTRPELGTAGGVLPVIEGRVPPPGARGPGCGFAPRCPLANRQCHEELPQIRQQAPEHSAACHTLKGPPQ